MHAERFEIPAETAAAIARARAFGGRVVAAGTTVVRALESAASPSGDVAAGEAETRLFIAPGYRWRVVDALLTNFHLPASTLLVLVCAFAGYDAVMTAYAHAVQPTIDFILLAMPCSAVAQERLRRRLRRDVDRLRVGVPDEPGEGVLTLADVFAGRVVDRH